VLFHHIFTVNTPIGRKVRAKSLQQGTLRIRQRRSDLIAAGVEFVARTAGAENGLPILEDGRTLEVRNVIWCTGFDNGLSWIDLPIFEDNGEPRHKSGVVESESGLYFVGQHFQHSMSSTMIHGVGRDAARMAAAIRERRVLRQRKSCPMLAENRAWKLDGANRMPAAAATNPTRLQS